MINFIKKIIKKFHNLIYFLLYMSLITSYSSGLKTNLISELIPNSGVIIEETNFKNGGIDLTTKANNPNGANTLWQNTSGVLFRGNKNLENLGDVIGATSSINNTLTSFSGTTGKLLKGSGIVANTNSGSLKLQTNGTFGSLGTSNSVFGNNSFLSETSRARRNTIIGSSILRTANTGGNILNNVFIGNNVCGNLDVADFSFGGINFNTIIGSDACVNASTASGNFDNNIVIGSTGGSNYTGSGESNNILIGNSGVINDQGKIRIGNITNHNSCFISGIYNAVLSGVNKKNIIIDENGQLGGISKSFGELNVENNIIETTITNISTDFSNKSLINIFTGSLGNNITLSPSTGSFTIINSGVYNLTMTFSITGGSNNTYSFVFFRNGITQIGVRTTKRINSVDIKNVSCTSFTNLVSGDVIAVYVQNETAANNLLVLNGSFTCAEF